MAGPFKTPQREVIHSWPDFQTGRLTCCDQDRHDVPQSDRATLTRADVTCDGTKRYRRKT